MPEPRVEAPISGPMFVPPENLKQDEIFKMMSRTRAQVTIGIVDGVPSYEFQFQGKIAQDKVFKMGVYFSQMFETYLRGLIEDERVQNPAQDIPQDTPPEPVAESILPPKLWLPGM